MKRNKTRWTRGEIKLLLFCAIVVGGFGGFGVWYSRRHSVPDLQIPAPQIPFPNALDFYQKAAFLGIDPVPGRPPLDAFYEMPSVQIGPDELPASPTHDLDFYNRHYPLSAKKTFLATNRTALATMRQGMGLPFQAPPQRKWWRSDRAIGGVRKLARILAVECHARVQAGDWEGAAQSALDMCKLGHDLCQGTIFEAEIGWQPMKGGQRELWKILPHLSAPAARRALKRLEILRKNARPYHEILGNEKWEHLASLQWVAQNNAWTSIISDSNFGNGRLHWLVWKLDVPQLFAEAEKTFDAQIANARKPYPAPQQAIPGRDEPNDPFNYARRPIFNARRRFVLHTAQDALLATALALHVYRLEKGHYPAQLSALVPNLLEAVPTDPCGNGEPLRYKATPKTYVSHEIFNGVTFTCKEFDTYVQSFAPPPGSIINPALPAPPPPPSAFHTLQIEGKIPYLLYSIGLDAKDEGGTPSVSTDSSRARGPSRHLLDKTWKINSGDLVAGINY